MVEPEPQVSTSTLDDARAHARAQAAGAIAPITIPSTAASDLPAGVASDDVVWDEVVDVGGYASRMVPRGAIVRLVDVDGDACANVVVFDGRNPVERLNVADTVKVQWQAYLAPGAPLLSDMGRVLM